MQATREFAREHGFVRNRARAAALADRHQGGEGPRRAAAERAAINAPMQGRQRISSSSR
jgi:DNA polymerase-1